MLERFTDDARMIVAEARRHARRLGHRYIGPEHLLLAAACVGGPASTVLREHGLSAERVEAEIVRLVGMGAGTRLFGDLDRDALSSIGVDLDTVRARIEASFGAGALMRAELALHGAGRRRRVVPGRLFRRLRRRRRRAVRRRSPYIHPAEAAARGQAVDAVLGRGDDWSRGGAPDSIRLASGGHVPFTPRAKKILERAFREAVGLHDSHIGVEHITLALVATESGLVRPILSALDASAGALRAAILERYREAS